MSTHILLLRGLNVGGRNILPMSKLVAILNNFGCRNVQTYIQSGNVVLSHDGSPISALAGKIESQIESVHGISVSVQLYRSPEWEQIVENNPFDTTNGKLLHVFFLHRVPVNPDLTRLSGLASASEKFALEGRAFYLHTPDGFGRSRLASKVERVLGVPTTARNWNTVMKISELSSSREFLNHENQV